MRKHWDFFKEADHSWGVFYPRNYIVAGYGSLAHAAEVKHALLGAGFGEDEVAVCDGDFMVNELESTSDSTWFDRIRQEIASALGTEMGYLEDDLEHARQGGAFLFVYVPNDPAVLRARSVIDPSRPVMARRYLALGIERYTYPPQAEIAEESARAVQRDQAA